MLKTLAAINQQDYDIFAQTNDMLVEGRARIRNFTHELEKLAEENNVEMTI